MLIPVLSFVDQAKHVAQSLSAFISILAEHAVQLANHLDALQKSHKRLQLELPASFADGTGDNLVVAHLELNSFMDTPEVRSRAALYVYLDVLVSIVDLQQLQAMLTYLAHWETIDQ